MKKAVAKGNFFHFGWLLTICLSVLCIECLFMSRSFSSLPYIKYEILYLYNLVPPYMDTFSSKGVWLMGYWEAIHFQTTKIYFEITMLLLLWGCILLCNENCCLSSPVVVERHYIFLVLFCWLPTLLFHLTQYCFCTLRKYKLPMSAIIPFPKRNDPSPTLDFPTGRHVLAVYPGTTALYKATVVNGHRKVEILSIYCSLYCFILWMPFTILM